MIKIEGSGSASGSESITQRHGSADPDPHLNVMDPQNCFCGSQGNQKPHFAMKLFFPQILWTVRC
jgi:hypothetical protein